MKKVGKILDPTLYKTISIMLFKTEEMCVKTTTISRPPMGFRYFLLSVTVLKCETSQGCLKHAVMYLEPLSFLLPHSKCDDVESYVQFTSKKTKGTR